MHIFQLQVFRGKTGEGLGLTYSDPCQIFMKLLLQFPVHVILCNYYQNV